MSATCRNGHVRAEENTGWYAIKGVSYPYCRDCNRINIAEKRAQMSDVEREEGKARGREAAKARHRRLRLQVVAAYGARCACCDEDREVFLALDHVNGGGSRHRKELGGTTTKLYRWAEMNNYPDIFQLLCHNCNFAKHREGVCPHATAS